MSKKRVHEIAKEHGLSSKELLEKLHAAGVEAKAAASSVEEATALQALGLGATAPASANGAPGADGGAPVPKSTAAPAPKSAPAPSPAGAKAPSATAEQAASAPAAR